MLSNVVDTITASDDALLDEMACSITGDNPLPRELVTGFTYYAVMCQVEKTTLNKLIGREGVTANIFQLVVMDSDANIVKAY